MNKVNYFISSTVLFLFLFSISYAQDIVKAEIGIKIISENKGARTERAAITLDRVRANDDLQIFLYPEDNSILYLIHCDTKFSTLLMKDSLKSKVLYILPASDSTYTIDGTSTRDNITILISPSKLKRVDEFF